MNSRDPKKETGIPTVTQNANLTSSSNPGISSIEVHVRLGENTSDVLSEVIAKINEARYELPRQIEDPVVTTATGNDALIYLAFFSEKLSVEQMTDYLMRSVQPELSSMDGVGLAEILGPRPGKDKPPTAAS